MEPQAFRVFDVNVTTAGSYQPGKPVQIILDVRANLPVGEAHLQVSTPEVEAAKMTGWDRRFQLPVDRPIPAAGSWQQSFARGLSARRTVAITIPERGYYSVVVSAIAQSDLPSHVDGRPVQAVTHKEIWVWIDPSGGRVTAEFDSTVFPEGLLARAGPARASRRSEGRGGAASAHPSAQATSAQQWNSIRYQALYYNQDSYNPSTNSFGRYVPLPNVYYSYQVTNVYTGNSAGGGSGYSDANGYFDVSCGDPYWEEYQGRLALQNSKIVMDNEGTDPYFGGDFFDCGEYADPNYPPTGTAKAPSAGAHVFRQMDITADRSRALLGRSRGQLQVELRAGEGTSNYSPFYYDDVEIYEDDVWGPSGIRTIAHEYGHAVHEKALGGNTASGSCPGGGHYMDGAHSLKCAYSEGFANYHAAATRGSEAAWTGDIEWNRFYPGRRYYSSDGQTWDGSIIEGAMAAFLLDLTDGSDGDADPIQYPGSYVADMIRTCQNDKRRANGIDDIIYCLEGQVDPAVRNSSKYFITRSSSEDASSASHSAGQPWNWSRSAIRQLWTRTLYGE